MRVKQGESMTRGFIAGVLFVVGVGLICAYAGIRSGVLPANADEKPSKLEAWAARTSLRASLARNAPSGDNPLPATDRNVIAGIKLYAQNCAICHGDASAHRTNVAKGLYQHPPQLAKDGVEDDPDGVTFWKVTHGIRWTGMPAFGKTLTQDQVWQLTAFLKTMDRLSPAADRAWHQVKS